MPFKTLTPRRPRLNLGMDFSTTSYGWRITDRVRERLIIGLTLSLLVHGLLLSLEFGIPGLGLPGLSAPWNERRAQMPELSVVLAPPPAAPAVPPAPTPLPSPPLVSPPIAEAKGLKLVPPRVTAPQPAPAKAKPVPAKPPKPRPAQVKSQPKLIAQAESRDNKFVVAPPDPDIAAESVTSKVETPNPPAEAAETPVPEQAPVKPEEPAPPVDTQAQLEQKRADEDAARQAREAEAKKQEQENAKRLAQEREKQQQAEQAAKEREAALAVQKEQEAAKKREQEIAAQRALELEQKRLAELKKKEDEKTTREAAELAARKQAEEEARRRSAELEQQRLRQAEELARQKQADELARQKQAEELAAKTREQEAARQRAEAAAAEQPRIVEETGRAAAAAAAARQGNNEGRQGGGAQRDPFGGGDLASRALEQVRRPDLLRVDPQRPGSREPERSTRRSVFGSLDRDVGLAMYIKSWSLKIERNGSLNYSQTSKDKARGDPVVTVAIRSDGSVEEVIINRSSGRADLDSAVRNIVRINARYSVFPPELARKYDVIEIRRIWNFDDTLSLIEEIR
jgi:TolA protein